MGKRTIMAVAGLAIFLSSHAALMSADKPGEAKESAYSLGDAGNLHVKLPEGWAGASDDGEPPTIALKAPAARHVSIQITPLPGKSADADLKRTAQAVGTRYAAGSKEKTTTLEELKGAGVRGYMSAYTDASEHPGEFRYVTAGMLACNDQVLAVTLLCNDKASADYAAAKEALKTLSITAPAAGGGAATAIKSPDEKWTLSIPGRWQIVDSSKSDDGKSREISALSSDGSMMLSVFMEPAAKAGGDAEVAREFYLGRMKRNPLPMKNLKSDLVGDLATLDYNQGPEELKQHNLNAYLSRDGDWVDVHISKVKWDEKTDRAAFDAVVKGLKAEAVK